MKLNSVYQDIWEKQLKLRMKKVFIRGNSHSRGTTWAEERLLLKENARNNSYVWVEERAIIQTENASYWSEHADVIYSDIKGQLDILPNHPTIRDTL